MSDIENRLAAVKTRIATANQEEARNDVLREHAEKQGTAALESLNEEFGVSSAGEAENLMAKFRKSLEEKLGKLENKLDTLGA